MRKGRKSLVRSLLIGVFALPLCGCKVGILVRESTHEYIRFIDRGGGQEIAIYQVELFRLGLVEQIKPLNEDSALFRFYTGIRWGDQTPFTDEGVEAYVRTHEPDDRVDFFVQNSPHTAIVEHRIIYNAYLTYDGNKIEYSIEYHLNGGHFEGEYPQSYCLMDIFNEFPNLKNIIPNPVKEGYVFATWFDDEGDPFDWEKVTGDVSLYAGWEKAE